MSFQTTFIEILKTRVPDHLSAVDEIAELLSISKDSAYRRLRGDTPLSLDEAVQLSLQFDISPAMLLEQATDLIPFRFNQLYGKNHSFKAYIEQMIEVIELVIKADGEIFYAAEDIPIFHHFRFPMLAAFKNFYWAKSVLDDETLNGRKFDKSMIHPELNETTLRLNKVYNEAKSVEIWAEESINSTLRQVEYYADSFQFAAREDADAVLDDLTGLIDHLERQAEAGSKLPDHPNPPKNFTLYDSDVLIGNNSIIIEGIPKPIVFISHNTFNSLRTRDRAFYTETRHWMDNLIKRSTLISGVSEKQRYRFFKRLRSGIADCKAKLEKMEF